MNKFDAMQVFMRVAEAGSFTAVAHQLQVDRSVVTRQVAALERYLGVKLMTRSTRRLTLTAAGADYLEQCQSILHLVDAAESRLTQDKGAPRGRIRLGLPLSYGLQQLMPLLIDFAQQHPLIELVMNFSDQRANLIEEGIDLSIRITARLDPTDIVRRLGRGQLQTLASPSYLERHGKPTHPDQLREHACLIYGQGVKTSTWVYRASDGKTLSVPVRGPITANNGVALMQAAAKGMGITIQPDFIAAPFLARGDVVSILKRFEPPPLGIYAVLPSNRYIPHRVTALIDYLATHLGESSR